MAARVDLHMEGLADDELIELVDQALAALNARYGGEDFEGARERFPHEPLLAIEVAGAITQTCERWDELLAYFNDYNDPRSRT